MKPFEFIILFFSFIYTLALTHLLFAWTRMVRHRRRLVFSWPHFLWMVAALANLSANWLSLWDFRSEARLSIATIASGFVMVVVNYFVCALVSPDFEEGETYDMTQFHQREGTTYIAAFLLLITTAIALNFLAGAELNVMNWSNQNMIVIAMLLPIAAALAIRRSWVQLLTPAMVVIETFAFIVIFYPTLAN